MRSLLSSGGLPSNTNLPFWSFNVSSVPVCKIQSLWNGTQKRSESEPCKLPSPSLISKHLFVLDMQSHLWLFLFITSARVVLPDCLENSQYPLRDNLSVNFSKLNPNQGVHLSISPERLSSSGPWTCFPCPGAWPSLATHYAEAPQWAVCALNNLYHNVGHCWATEQGLPSKSFTVAIAGNGHKEAGFSQAQLWLPGKWKLSRILIQGC